MVYWLVSISPENWEIMKKELKFGSKRDLSKFIKKEDYLIVYVRGTYKIKGIFKVTSDWYEANDLLWNDEKEKDELIYKYRIDVEPVKITEIDVRGIVDRLSFIEKKDKWFMYFSRKSSKL